MTCSNTAFSPYACFISPRNADYDVASALLESITCDEESDDPELLMAEPEPSLPVPSLPANSTPTTPDPNDTAARPTASAASPSVTPPSHPQEHAVGRKRRLAQKKKDSHERRKKRRVEKKEAMQASAYADAEIRARISERYSNDGPQLRCDISTEKAKVARTAFVALKDRDKHQTGRTYSLEEVTGEDSELKFRLEKWDGTASAVILDKSGRIVAVLAGWPDDQDWGNVHRAAAEALEGCRPRCIFTGKANRRRGAFPALHCGVSHGGGQRHPMNLNEGHNKRVIEELNQMECFKRIAGFGSAVMKSRAPKIYGHYVEKLGQLHQKNPKLQRPFASSAFSAATYNLGPQTACYKHKDFANLPYGWCSVTALGSFDHTKGGHLILWDCELVIEFPPGATVLLPSAIVAHSNTSVSPQEARYSFTQYSAGALFRWVENGYQTAVAFQASLSSDQIEMQKKKNAERWMLGLSLWPVVDSIDDPCRA